MSVILSARFTAAAISRLNLGGPIAVFVFEEDIETTEDPRAQDGVRQMVTNQRAKLVAWVQSDDDINTAVAKLISEEPELVEADDLSSTPFDYIM